MHYRLRDGLSYCESDGIAIFLDIDSDRYFRLPAALESAFLHYAAGSRATTEEIQSLIQRGVLEPSAEGWSPDTTPQLPIPTRSAVELVSSKRQSSATMVPEVFLTTWSVQRQLKTRPLKAVLDTAAQHRRTHLQSHDLRTPRPDTWLLESIARFRRARLHVPIATRCLLDSLTLTRFLARRGQDSKIVFGVAHEPFSAHCWVQIGDMVLNDSIGNVMTHTPIKVI